MKRASEVTKGSTDVSIYLKITSGLTISDLDLQYTRYGELPSTKVDLVALGGGADSVHTDNRAIYVDDTNSPGLLRVDVPDAAFATSCDEVYIFVKHSTGSWVQTVSLVNAVENVNVYSISDDTDAADALETMLDGTGGNKLSISQLRIIASGNDSAIHAIGSGSGDGIRATGGATGNGQYNTGGTSGGSGILNYSASYNAQYNWGGNNGIVACGPGGYDITCSNNNNNLPVDVTKISGDSVAADNFETMLDGTGGKKLTLSQLNIVATRAV